MAITQSNPIDHDRALRRLVLYGASIVVLFCSVVGGWAARVPIAGAVVAPGQLVVNQNIRKVQHPTGGIVGEIRVNEGKFVSAGEVVLRLDETVMRASLQAVQKKIDELEVRQARLETERSGKRSLDFPSHLTRRTSEPQIAEMLSTEHALFAARRASHELRKSRLEMRIQQLREEHASSMADLKAKQQLAKITSKELTELRSLDARKLVTTNRLNSVERDAVGLDGQQAQLAAALRQIEGKVLETEMQSAGIDDELRAETTKELREVQAELAQQQEKRVAAVDALQRIDVRAPVSGQVHQLAVHTVGGVISAAEPIMLIVPSEEQLELEVRILPHDVDQLVLGQPATVRLNAFNQRTTPELRGEVVRISGDVVKDQATGMQFYSSRVALDPKSVAELGALKLQAGMQATALITTSDRTAWEYMSKPIVDQMRRAFRER
jgi:HlyD family secretion protein